MSIVNVPIVNSTLVNPRLLDLRVKFIQNDVELLRRQFEVYGIELSSDLINLYIKTLILYNANVVWDLKAVSYRKTYQQTYTNNTHKMIFDAPFSVSLPQGVLSVDPITLSFMTFAEAKKLIEYHVKTVVSPVYDVVFKPFDVRGYVELEKEMTTKYGAFNVNYIANNANDPYNPTSNMPVSNRMNHDASLWYQQKATKTGDAIKSLFQNPTLEMKSLLPAINYMFQQNPYQKTGIPFKPYYDYESIHCASIDSYLAVFRPRSSYTVDNQTNIVRFSDARGILKNMPVIDEGYHYYTYSDGYGGTVEAKVAPDTIIAYDASVEIPALVAKYRYPSTDTRTDYQKTFTNQSFTPDQISTKLNADPIALKARVIKLNKEFIESKGGHASPFIATMRLIAEAHASVMTPINLLNTDFASLFTKTLVVYGAPVPLYNSLGNQVGTTPSIKEVWVFLDSNFKVTTMSYNKSYTAAGGDAYNINNGLNILNSTSYASYAIKGPIDITKPYLYYMIDNNTAVPTHLVKTTALLGIQRLRNGFLYQDIERNWEPTFVNFDEATISQLESLATKQMAMYDLLDDVKLGNVYQKVITTQVPVQPFNPSMPQYTTSTSSIDMLRTEEGDVPLIHPEEEFAIRWQALHAEFVLLSSYYYNNFEKSFKPTIDDYNNRVATVINNILAEMKTLSATYSQAEADKLKAEQDQTALEVKLEKLRSGIFIDDNGREYWRPLTADEQIAVDKMVAQVQANLATIQQNKVNEEQNTIFQTQADEARKIENEQRQAQVDAEALAQNELNQKMADEGWARENITGLVPPTLEQISKYSDESGLTLTESLYAWMNQFPYFSYNPAVAMKVEELRLKIKQAEDTAALGLVTAKINEIGILKALKEMFILTGK